MKKVTLYIETAGEAKTVEIDDEISIGRTNASKIVLDDVGLSRLNTTFFRDGDLVFVVDENSLNGTFVNDEKISNQPQRIFDGDAIKIGSETCIRVESRESRVESKNFIEPPTKDKGQKTKDETIRPKTKKPPFAIIVAVASTFAIIFFALVGILVANYYEDGVEIVKGKPTPKIVTSAPIPIRVVDPLGGEPPESLDDLMEAWEVQDAEFTAENLTEVKTSTDAPQLAVSVADWETQRNLAMGKRSAPVGLVSGVTIPPELGGGIAKQLALFRQQGITPDTLPKDFAALARMRMANQLTELPLATKFYYLDNIGTSADGSEFDSFEPNTRTKSPLILNSEDYSILKTLANNYNGQKYDLNNSTDRLQMKRRLLRMFHPRAKAFLEELGAAYYAEFNRPLKVTSLTRSLEYQFDLSKATRNAYRGTTPPHSTGATFDLAYMQMTAKEQTFLMAKLAEYEKAGRVDALREVAQTPCLHIFVIK
ncbi:MAG: DUF5715 family protein [Acidobacteriota bacterium]